MHKISWTLVALFAMTLNGLAQSDVSKARWKSKEIVVDGNDHEWTKPLNFYDDKSGLMFAICNDQRNVYFAFRVKDEMKVRKLMSAGWSVELSSKEKDKKFNATLTFPAVNMAGMNRRPGDQFEKKVAGNPFINAYRLQLQSVAVKGFKSNHSELKLNNHEDIDIAIGTDSEQFIVYEIAIPLKELMAENLVQLDELITLSVSVNALDRPSAGGEHEGRTGGRSDRSDQDMAEMRGETPGGGMGGGRRGMTHGGGYSTGGSGDRGDAFGKASFKQKFTLTKD